MCKEVPRHEGDNNNNKTIKRPQVSREILLEPLETLHGVNFNLSCSTMDDPEDPTNIWVVCDSGLFDFFLTMKCITTVWRKGREGDMINKEKKTWIAGTL